MAIGDTIVAADLKVATEANGCFAKAEMWRIRRGNMRRVGLLILSLIVGLSPSMSRGGSYPDRPIRLVVGFGVGGPTDIPARFIADKLSEALGQRVFVENKPASGGIVATRDVIARPADGYTLLLCTHFEPINVAAYKDPGFKLSDLAPISLIAKYYYGLALSNAIPPTDIGSFIAYAKAHPGQVNYGTVGFGSAQEILARQLEKVTGITMNQVPFRGGAQPVQEIVAGRIDFYTAPPLALIPHYRDRQLKIIAVSSPERLDALPEVPTLAEAGINFIRSGWLGVCAPAGTPAAIIELLNRDIAPIVRSLEYRTLIETAGSIAAASTPEELERIMQQTLAEVAPTIAEFHLQRE
jgi:tripartite-type tricarboxylate transporter receptor subunit TctC